MSPQIENLPSGSSGQRNSLNHQAIEDYLKTIYILSEVLAGEESEEQPEGELRVSTSRIAEARQVKPASATSMIQRLAELNLVDYKKHYGVTLTQAGRQIALEVIRHHRLIELYLMEALGFRWDEVHEQADILEHVISEKLEERIAAALNHPTHDPHGDPIPAKDGTMIRRDVRPLATLAPGEKARVARVVDDANTKMLRYLEKLGLLPGAVVHVQNVAPFDGPLTLEVDDEEAIIGFNAANAVLVELLDEL